MLSPHNCLSDSKLQNEFSTYLKEITKQTWSHNFVKNMAGALSIHGSCARTVERKKKYRLII